MKPILTASFLLSVAAVFAQAVPAPKPVEQHYQVSYWWWVLGVLLAIGVGVAIYMLIKKDPKRDAVR